MPSSSASNAGQLCRFLSTTIAREVTLLLSNQMIVGASAIEHRFLFTKRSILCRQLAWRSAMFASVARIVQLWYCTQRACRELEILDDRSLEDIGVSPYEVSYPRARF